MKTANTVGNMKREATSILFALSMGYFFLPFDFLSFSFLTTRSPPASAEAEVVSVEVFPWREVNSVTDDVGSKSERLPPLLPSGFCGEKEIEIQPQAF